MAASNSPANMMLASPGQTKERKKKKKKEKGQRRSQCVSFDFV